MGYDGVEKQVWRCREASLEVQLARSQSKIRSPKVWMRPKGSRDDSRSLQNEGSHIAND